MWVVSLLCVLYGGCMCDVCRSIVGDSFWVVCVVGDECGVGGACGMVGMWCV